MDSSLMGAFKKITHYANEVLAAGLFAVGYFVFKNLQREFPRKGKASAIKTLVKRR